MNSSQLTPEMETLKNRLRASWTAGDFGVIAKLIATSGSDFVAGLDIQPGMKALDVACGTGNTAIPAAKRGAEVTGVDIAPNLIEQAIARAEAEGVDAKFDVGDAEDMPYDDNSFDAVITMFGAMFAPRPDVVASELKRVCKSGGYIAMANWCPDSFTGEMFKTGSKHVPPPPGMVPPVLWGDESTVRDRFADGISDLWMQRVGVTFEFEGSPEDIVEHFRTYFGPTQKAFESLDAAGQNALRKDLVDLWTKHNQADDGSTRVSSEYLKVVARRS